ncbi:MAG TPA: DUF2723 domain-containing protein, partial [Anaerolineae bacterium]|nr:DUF2723 domain-containing protein [Anaerolineae bacterium]
MAVTRVQTTKSTLSWQRLLFLFYWPWELIPLLVTCAWLYRQTMPPGISSWIIEGWDSAVLQITGSTWGIPHSPGYPLYTILANIFVRLVGLIPGLSATSVAWRVSFWSTTTSLLTLTFLYFIVWKLTRDRVAAAIASLILGISFIFWRGAIMAEVYSLNGFLFAFTYWLALTWEEEPQERWLFALGLAVGAAIVHHRTALILPPTIALWVLLKTISETDRGRGWIIVLLFRWAVLGVAALIPLLSYLYLPWAAKYRVGQTWLYADTSDWNTFWFVVFSREWWGLVKIPDTTPAWWQAFKDLFRQQGEQITSGGVICGLIGLLTTGRHLVLFGPPVLALIFFGTAYQVADLDSMLIPLTLTLCIGLGALIGRAIKWSVDAVRIRGEAIRDAWLRVTVRTALSIGLAAGFYFVFRPLAAANYEAVDLSGDWQAEDLVEEVAAMAGAGTPLIIIGQDNSVLPDFIYAQVVLGQPVEPLSTTTLSRMPEAASIALLQEKFKGGRRVLVDIETIDLNFIPWLSGAIRAGRILLAPTGHPYLWELLPRPMPNVLPEREAWSQIPPGQFVEGRVSV